MSCNNNDQTVSIDSCDESQESMTFSSEGFDYKFVPPLAKSYECPICLLTLREPRQTKCGHRFCRDCIHQWLSTKFYCPVDHGTLTTSKDDIFADTYVRREVMTHDIKCPNHEEGCQTLTTILYLQNHLGQCQYALVPCPLNCPSVLRRRSMDHHVTNECVNRVVACPNCGEQMIVSHLYDHTAECPKEVIQCNECQADVYRDEMSHHLKTACQRMVVPCPFSALGCQENMCREEERQHLTLNSSSHMEMLASSYFTLLENFNSLAVDLNQLTGRNLVSKSEVAISPAKQDTRIVRQRSSDSKVSHKKKSVTSPVHIEKHGFVYSLEKRSMSTRSMSSNELEDDLGVESSYHSLPATTGTEVTPDDAMIHSSKSAPVLEDAQSVSTSVSVISTPDHYLNGAPNGKVSEKTVPEFASSLYRLCANQAHMLEKQQIVIANLCNQMSELEERLTCNEEQKVHESVQRSCGDFYWTIDNFSLYKKKALEDEETSIFHSPPFFSSPWGYKMCLRVNVKSTPNSEGEHHLSLFIHFMQGDHDHLLNWPFGGQIVLSVLDQNPSHRNRRHVSETLKARPEVAAFQKPTSVRNHKGFGYTDFISLGFLERGTFIIDDSIIVRAQVHPSTE